MSSGAWFSTPGRPGRVTLEHRLAGLYVLNGLSRGGVVLDLGAAEGLIARALIQQGIAAGADLVERHVAYIKTGRRLCEDVPARWHQVDLGEKRGLERLDRILRPRHEIVLALAVLQKMPDPAALLRWAASHCSDLLVVRVPSNPFAPKAGGELVDVRLLLRDEFESVAEPPVSGAWLAVFRRRT